MADKKNPLGPTGETVRRNVARLRGGMQYKELAARLEAHGRPIPALGLRRIEAGERRVDADDLVALAVVLGVSPLTLLLPADAAPFMESEITGVPDRAVSHNRQWSWAMGREPLQTKAAEGPEEDRERLRYRMDAIPPLEYVGEHRLVDVVADTQSRIIPEHRAKEMDEADEEAHHGDR